MKNRRKGEGKQEIRMLKESEIRRKETRIKRLKVKEAKKEKDRKKSLKV